VSELVDEVEQPEEGTGRMTFLEHLEELRKRLLYAVYGVAAGCAVSFFFVERLTLYLEKYLTQFGGRLIFTEFTGGFMFYFMVGGVSGLILAAPVVFWQGWLFVAPGLYQREKKIVIPFVASSSLLFGSGVAFAHFVAIPSMLKFFSTFESPYVDMRINMSEAFDFYVKMVLAFGIVFQLPILIFFLARFGIVTAGFLWRNFKYAFLIIFIIAAIATPTSDPVNQTIFAAPMVVLYILSIGVAYVFQKKKPADDV